jgi:acetyl-CoA carboxylase carboxyl transferase subunit beta
MKSINEWFSKKKEQKAKTVRSEKLDIPGNLWVKCFGCNATIYSKDLEANMKVCPKCNYHFRLTSPERLKVTVDEGSFMEYDKLIISKDFLNFTDSMPYKKRLEDAKKKTGLNEAITTGTAKISGQRTGIGIMDFSFIGGSLGSVVGEKVARLIERSIEQKEPVIIFNASGGARMQEAIMSLMQMAKTSAALAKLRKAKLPYISVCTDPTMAGVSASYATLGDIIISEPDALVGFAGPRVIESTIKQKLPEGFQRADFVMEHGFMDMIVARKDMKETLGKILAFFMENK